MRGRPKNPINRHYATHFPILDGANADSCPEN